jgi:hypothetical protein
LFRRWNGLRFKVKSHLERSERFIPGLCHHRPEINKKPMLFSTGFFYS